MKYIAALLILAAPLAAQQRVHGLEVVGPFSITSTDPTVLTFVPIAAAAVPPAGAGTSNVYVNSTSGFIETKDDAGAIHSLSSTDNLTEGATNLYYTDARARAAISATAPLSYDSPTGVLSCATCDGGTGTTINYWQASAGRGGGIAPGAANQIRIQGFIAPGANIQFSRIMANRHAADTTGCTGGCLYSFGIYDTGGALVARVDPVQFGATGSVDYAITGGGTVTLAAGTKYYFAFTGNGTGGQISYHNSSNFLQWCSNSSVTTASADGVLPANITIPAGCDPTTTSNWTMQGFYPFFGLRQ